MRRLAEIRCQSKSFLSAVQGTGRCLIGALPWRSRAAALGTSFLSGVFGMMGGLVLMGVLRPFLPVPAATTQSLGHGIKFTYFTWMIVAPLKLEPATIGRARDVPIWIYGMAASLAIRGTTLAKPMLDRFSNDAFQNWSRRLVLGIGVVYLLQGGAALMS